MVATTTSMMQVSVDWRNAWLEGKTQRTAAAYAQALRAFEAWFQKRYNQAFDLPMFTAFDMRAWREYSLGVQKVQPQTWNLRRTAMAVLAKFCLEYGLISQNPMRDVRGEPEQEIAPRWLTDAEFGQLSRWMEIRANLCNTDQRKRRAKRDNALVTLMLHAGLRESEAAALEVSDLVIKDRSGKATVRRGKGDKKREVQLNSEARRSLSIWLEEQPQGLLFAGISTRMIQKIVKEIGAMAGIEELTPHRLRHTFAKRMVDAGRPLTEVQRLLGHTKIETTSRYTMAGEEDLAEAVESVIGGKTNRR